MSRLAEIQHAIRDAVVTGDAGDVKPLLMGGQDPAKRLALHHRHYRASLVDTLLTRFPALTWLVGGAAIGQAAEEYVRAHPPSAPCLAEYGETFPAFVAGHLRRSDAPYIQPFGELEWHVGAVSIAIDLSPCSSEALSDDADALGNATAVLQPGLRYLRAEWPVHDLMKKFLSDTAPDFYELRPASVWIEVRGARGEFAINELDAGTWTFRSELQRGLSLEAAALGALAVNDTFDPGYALAALITSRLLVDLRFPDERLSQ